MKSFQNFNVRPDTGPLYENYVFTLLDSKKDILTTNYFYRTQAKTEIDFIVCRENDVCLIEVKAGVFNRPIRAMTEFEKKYQDNSFKIKKIVVNKSYIEQTGNLNFIPAYLL